MSISTRVIPAILKLEHVDINRIELSTTQDFYIKISGF